MENLLTYYKLLDVPTDASTEEILKAYKEKAKAYHPDKNGGGQAAHEMFLYLGQAKEWLIDPRKRLQYDYMIGVKKKPGSDNHGIPRQQSGHRHTAPPDAAALSILGVIVGVALGAAIFGEDD